MKIKELQKQCNNTAPSFQVWDVKSRKMLKISK